MPAPVDGNEFHLHFRVVAPEHLLDLNYGFLFFLYVETRHTEPLEVRIAFAQSDSERGL